MSGPTGASAQDERLGLLDALIYADVFDCAVTLDELWRYSRVEIGREALARRLLEDPLLAGIVWERDGLYCLDGREALVGERPERLERARLLERRARWVARLLRHLPFIRGLALTGSAAAGDAHERADVDMLVIVAPERLGTAFLLLGSASRLLGRQLFCPNYYVRQGSLPTRPRNLYLARELAQLRGLGTRSRSIHDADRPISKFFPNASVNPGIDLSGATRLQRLLEAPLRGAMGKRVERVGRRVALARLRAHHGALDEEVPPDVWADFEAGRALRFHRGQVQERTLERYAARRAEVASRFERLAREQAQAVE
jgi:predicted nucleotidyltransferase